MSGPEYSGSNEPGGRHDDRYQERKTAENLPAERSGRFFGRIKDMTGKIWAEKELAARNEEPGKPPTGNAPSHSHSSRVRPTATTPRSNIAAEQENEGLSKEIRTLPQINAHQDSSVVLRKKVPLPMGNGLSSEKFSERSQASSSSSEPADANLEIQNLRAERDELNLRFNKLEQDFLVKERQIQALLQENAEFRLNLGLESEADLVNALRKICSHSRNICNTVPSLSRSSVKVISGEEQKTLENYLGHETSKLSQHRVDFAISYIACTLHDFVFHNGISDYYDEGEKDLYLSPRLAHYVRNLEVAILKNGKKPMDYLKWKSLTLCQLRDTAEPVKEDKRIEFVIDTIMSGVQSIFQIGQEAEIVTKLRSQFQSQVVLPAVKLAYQFRRHVPSLLLYIPGRHFDSGEAQTLTGLRRLLKIEFDEIAVDRNDDLVVNGLTVVPGIIRASFGINGLANTAILLKAQAVVI